MFKERHDQFPTEGQISFAGELGIRDQITLDMTSADVSALIKEALRRRQSDQRIRDAHRHRSDTEQASQKLQKLIASGLCVGARIRFAEYELEYMIVQEFHIKDGTVTCSLGRGCPRKNRFVIMVSPEKIDLPDVSPQQDPDLWAPVGFVAVPHKLANEILANKFGDYFKEQLLIRDSFFQDIRRCFFSERVFQQLQIKIDAQKRARKERIKNEVRQKQLSHTSYFCIQCGGKMQVPADDPNAPLNAKIVRCNACQVNRIKLSQWKHCVICGKKFYKKPSMPWAQRKHCDQHFQQTQ